MYGDVAEADHVFEGVGKGVVDVVGLGEEGEDVAGALGDAQSVAAVMVMVDPEGDFAGAQDVEEGRVLAGDVSGEAGRVFGVCLASAGDAAGEVYPPPSSAPRIIRASSSMG